MTSDSDGPTGGGGLGGGGFGDGGFGDGGFGGELDAGAGEPLVGRGSAGRADLGALSGDTRPEAAPELDRAGPGRSRTRPSVPRPPWTPPRRARPGSWVAMNPGGTRLGLGVALAVVLGLAWLVVGQPGSGSAAPVPTVPTNESFPTASTAPMSTTTRAVPVERAVAVPAWVPAAIAATCRAHAGALARTTVVVDCTPGRGVARLEFRAFASVTRLRAAYAGGGSVPAGGIGAPACAHGVAEERSWSTAAAPSVPVGRYRCARAQGHARIAWTSEHAGAEDVAVLAVATRSDADLRALYQWWTTVPGPTPMRPETHERREP